MAFGVGVRWVGLALTAAASIGLAAGGAHAKQRSKAIPSFGPALIDAAMESGAAAAPAQFFTINEVLARKAEEAVKAKATIRLASLGPIGLRGAIYDDAPANRATAGDSEPFGLLSFRAPEGLLWVKWRSLQTRIRQDRETLEDCREDANHCPAGARKFNAIIHEAKALEGRKRLEFVNTAVNSAVRYVSDHQQHGVADLWSSPLATFGTGAGDCEDYAIAKHVALIEAEVPSSDLRILLVKHLALGEAHAVVSARIGEEWLVLDNLAGSVVEDHANKNLLPLFALDHKGVSLLAGAFRLKKSADNLACIENAARQDYIETLLPAARS